MKDSAIFLIMFVLFIGFLSPIIYGYDGVGYYVYLRSFVIDGNLDFENEYEHYKEIYPYIETKINPITSKITNQYTIGTSLFWSPFFLITHLFFRSDGYSLPYSSMVTLGSVIYCFIGLYLMYKLCCEFVERKFALIGVFVFWLSSHLFFYTYLLPSLSHAISFFSVSLFLCFWYFHIKDRLYPGGWGIFGVITGLMVLVRPQNAIYLLIPLVNFEFSELKGAVLGSFTFFLTILPQLFVWKYLTGSYFALFSSMRVSQHIGFNILNVLSILFSNKHGLFNWTPVFLLGFIGLILLFKENKRLILSFFLVILTQLIVVAGWDHWWGGYGFGNRFLLSTSVLFIIGFAYLLQKINKRWWIIALILIGWNFNLMYQYGSRMICGDCAASPIKIIKNGVLVCKNILSRLL